MRALIEIDIHANVLRLRVELVIKKTADVFFELWEVEVVGEEGEGFGVPGYYPGVREEKGENDSRPRTYRGASCTR